MNKHLFEEAPSENVLLVDGHNVIFRTIFAAQSELDRSKMEDPKFTYFKIYFLNTLKFLVEQFKPTRLIVSIDSKNGWRKKIYPSYKEQRKKARDDSKVDFQAFFKILDPFIDDLKQAFQNIEILKIDEAEGDDIIAVVCQILRNDNITIISTDHDFYQLQQFKNVKQWDPKEKSYATPLNAETSLDAKIIGGDKNDNIPAIYPRLGKVSIAKILNSEFMTNLNDENYYLNEDNRKNFITKYRISPEQCRQNYIRNTQLIDFKHIPTEIKTKISEKIQNPDIKKFDGRKFNSFLFDHELSSIIPKSKDYTDSLGKLLYEKF